ncbi:hypothetical protein GGX14DRAFT_666626 [Mycena pura]|uniref:Uncharacterized protein n=1 Tax=Mycena pura TaxID=153505 RepID=A0AAD6V2U3_9AGAR|nr:hypothetical protein GGX14DRAFT_666626 [Mycena pura]
MPQVTTTNSQRYLWALISPSAHHSVAYLRSPLATSSAAAIQCGEYLVLVKLATSQALQTDYGNAYLVQPSRLPLPQTYLPIAPCPIGPREALCPGFQWPFEQCVIDTSQVISLEPVYANPPANNTRFELSDRASDLFLSFVATDRRKAALTDDEGTWTSSGSDGLRALPRPGQIYAPLRIKAHLRYDILSLKEVLPAHFGFHDELKIKRFVAQCSRPYWEKTTRWTRNQVSCSVIEVLHERPIYDLSDAALIDLSLTLHRPHSPGQDEPAFVECDKSASFDHDDWSESEERWVCPPEARLAANAIKLPPQPKLVPGTLKIIYLDVFGTLVDNESGIFYALQPLLARSAYRFERHDALSHYFELESEVKKRTPTMPYFYILAQTYTEFALRLGLPCSHSESMSFASSIFYWPLHHGALESLNTLRAHVPAFRIVGLIEVDLDTFVRMAHYALLQPYFAEMYTHDLGQAYCPHPWPSEISFLWHDKEGRIPRQERLLVSNSMFRNLQPAMMARVPCVWVRFPTSLAARLPTAYCQLPWRVCQNLHELAGLLSAEEDTSERKC